MTVVADSSAERTLAAIDLGSNSFHMVVARLEHGLPVVVDRIREQVQLAAGLAGPNKRIGEEPWARALDCLGRFKERVAALPAGNVRAVGTNALRKAHNAREFVEAARVALGHDIEVVSGREEARLIFLGVSHAVGQEAAGARRLVIDIGGGSTELIVGDRFTPLERDSVQMGCIAWRRRWFEEGVVTEHRMRRATVAARLEVRSLEQRYRNLGWDVVLGSSGTIKSIDQVLRANRWSTQGISRGGLARLRAAVLEAGTTDALKLAGLASERTPLLPGGLALLLALFDAFEIEEMTASGGALREGLLHDLLGRIRREDVRDRTIRNMQDRYAVDHGFAGRVERTALMLFHGACEAWGIDRARGGQFLRWAACLHEVGLSIAHSGHHRHGAYVVRNSDMPGFSRDDQELLAGLVLGHRRKVTRERLKAYVSAGRVEMVLRLCICLRLARRLNRVRRGRRQVDVSLTVLDDRRLRLNVEDGWLDRHPLSRADLTDEAWLLQASGYELEGVQAEP